MFDYILKAIRHASQPFVRLHIRRMRSMYEVFDFAGPGRFDGREATKAEGIASLEAGNALQHVAHCDADLNKA
jgi:hypothetical protein